ncbi:hypothetical protein SAMN05443665_10179 [Actinomadura meyerae]|jgi:NADP-dependent 3-hydroxy acid dehydrogenase YdfG|uniref:Uncharacterized protein n=2 Tax=Actinomadura meyerae TaxID=240840 RepID=A0A239K532_9ACTN|nr:hypothetical protein SAMN05443665_10179 [Actinomadura meyerae]
MDVTDRAAVFEGVKRAGEHFDRLDVIVDNGRPGGAALPDPLIQRAYEDRLQMWADGQDLSAAATRRRAHRLTVQPTG